jgi:hypothetical protein
MQESLEIGAERVRYPIYQVEAVIVAHQIEEYLGLTLETVETVEKGLLLLKAMERPVTSVTGSERVHFHLFLNKNVVHEMEVVHAQTMSRKEMLSETVNHLPLNGVKAAHKAHKMVARDRQDANFRNGRLLNVPLQQPNRIINGAPK